MGLLLHRMGLLEQGALIAEAEAVGFTALKSTTANTPPSTVTDWDSKHWDPENNFDLTTGKYTPSQTGFIYWIAGGGLMLRVGGVETQLRVRRNDVAEIFSRGILTTTDQRYVHYVPGFYAASPADEFTLFQVEDAVEDAWFSAFAIDTAHAFMGWKPTAVGGGANGPIETYDTELLDLGNNFVPSTGLWTCPVTGLYLVNAMGFPESGQDGGTWGIATRIDGVETYRSEVRNESGAGNFGYSVGYSLLLNITAGQTLKLYEHSNRIGEIAHHVAFSAALLPAIKSGFAARKATGTGSAGDIISGWTEDFDVGPVFDAASGVFTASVTRPYLVIASAHEDPAATLTDPPPEVQLIHTPFGGSATTFLRDYHRIGSNFTNKSNHGMGVVMNLGAGDQVHLKQVNYPEGNCFFGAYEL